MVDADADFFPSRPQVVTTLRSMPLTDISRGISQFPVISTLSLSVGPLCLGDLGGPGSGQ